MIPGIGSVTEGPERIGPPENKRGPQNGRALQQRGCKCVIAAAETANRGRLRRGGV